MNRMISAAAAAAFAAFAATTAHAAVSNNHIDAIGAFNGGTFSVIQADKLDYDDADITDYGLYRAGQQDPASVQDAIRSNPELLRKLQARNVQIGNVLAVTPAFDGSLTFYLR